MLKDFLQVLRYRIERLFVRDTVGQLMLLLFLVALSTVIGLTAQLFGLFGEDNLDVASIPRDIDGGFWDALWWTLQRVLYMSRLEQVYGGTAVIVVYSIFLTFVGMVVFATVFSLITTAISNTLQSLRKGDTAVKERGHTLILGWSDKIYPVLRQLAELRPGSKIVLLSPLSVVEMEDALRIAGMDKENLTIILRTGDATRLPELERVAFNQASSIIVLSPSTARDSLSADSEVIKTILQMVRYQGWGKDRPNLTAEIARERNYELAQIASHDSVDLVSSSTVISKIIVQSMRNPGLVDVYRELLARIGNNIQVMKVADCVDQEIGLSSFGFHDAIPVGVSWEEEKNGRIKHATGLNPEPDYELAEDEKLVLMMKGTKANFSLPAAMPESALIRDGSQTLRPPENILLVGWNGNIYDILVELDAHAIAGTEITILSSLPETEAKRRLQTYIRQPLRNLNLRNVSADSVEEHAYADIDLASCESIAVLADKSAGEADVDARTLRTMLRLNDLIKATNKKPHVVLELQDQANRDLVSQLGVDDVIASFVAVSAQLAQISQQTELGPIYRELLSAGGVEISLRPAADYVAMNETCGFTDLMLAAQQRMEIALGLRRVSADGAQLLLNPDRNQRWELNESDRVVVLAQQVYR
ncbi:MAG: CASTOR/POLLUX-related putative ion channel [Gammaproteobacteria bacterium]